MKLRMKRIVIAVGVAVLISVASAFALDTSYYACTADELTAVIDIVLNDDAVEKDSTIPQHIEAAFAEAARTHTANELVTPTGFIAFMALLTDADKAALQTVYRPNILDHFCPLSPKALETRR